MPFKSCKHIKMCFYLFILVEQTNHDLLKWTFQTFPIETRTKYCFEFRMRWHKQKLQVFVNRKRRHKSHWRSSQMWSVTSYTHQNHSVMKNKECLCVWAGHWSHLNLMTDPLWSLSAQINNKQTWFQTCRRGKVKQHECFSTKLKPNSTRRS